MKRYQLWLFIGAILGCLAMISASVGAHGLQFYLKSQRVEGQSLSEAQIADKQLDWETAARLQMYHALALLAVGILAAKRCGWAIHLAGFAMTLGTLLFSGCLYAYVLGGPRWLVHVVPIGGLLLIVGWACLAVAACRHQEADAAGQRVV